MCVIAGYTGKHRAAPILIEMMKRVEYMDGGLATGIATIHEGKLYSVKCLGSVDELVKNTDALSFPGTTGIIHTRPAGGRASHAHPFVAEGGEFAFCENGTYYQVAAPEYKKNGETILADLYGKGVTFTSAIGNPGDKWDDYHMLLPNGQTIHNAESYTQYIGDAVRNVPAERLADAIAEKTAEALSLMPSELVTLSVHARLPDTITVGRLTRAMSFASHDGDSYLCTTPMGFPAEVQAEPITFLPTASISQVTSKGLHLLNLRMDGVTVEQADARIESIVRVALEEGLRGRRDDPVLFYDLSKLIPNKESLWLRPMNECRIVSPAGNVKELTAVVYRVLWSFYREGRLRYTLGQYGKYLPMFKFWLED